MKVYAPIVLSLVVSLLVASVPAEAAKPTMVRCEATLVSAEGARTTLSGWGAEEVGARAAALAATRIVADQDLVAQLGVGMLLQDAERGAVAEARLLATDAASPLRVPGFSLEEGACETVPAPKSKTGYRAAWGDGEAVGRGEPAVAVEAARRRACLAPYVAAFTEAMAASGQAAIEDKVEILGTGADRAVEALRRCYAEGVPTLEADPEGSARIASGTWRCDAVEPGREGMGPVAVGWGRTAERAGEDALRRAAHARTVRGLGMALEGAATASPEMVQSVIAAGLSEVADLVSFSDAVDLAYLVCGEVAADATPSWMPVSPERLAHCSEDVAAFPMTPATGGADSATHEALCQERVWGVLAEVQEAVRKTEPPMRSMVMANGWSILDLCEASCLARTTTGDGFAYQPVLGTLDRTSKEAMIASIEEAIRAKDIDGLSAVMTGMHLARMRRVFLRDPDRFWEGSEEMLAPGVLEEMLTWMEYEGALFPLPGGS
ncbi:MAG: hypothetical protein JRJ84_10625 [Deltaproteobacteria bacterium]|nr:hypothetical protein [Deltaproteobacteria bacterium]